MQKSYYVFAIKSTRKPTVLASEVSWDVACSIGQNYYDIWRRLNDADLASTGVSVRVYDYDASTVDIGDPDFVLGKPAIMSWGAV